MLANITIPIEPLLLLALGVLALQMFHRQGQRAAGRQSSPVVDYLYKIARITGRSEYEIFRKSAENWPVSKGMIDRDFKDYLINQDTPHYVNDFIRRNRKYIDELKLPPL